MRGLIITTSSADEESRKILVFGNLPDAIRDRVLIAAYMVAKSFDNGEIGECDSMADDELEELGDAVREMERHAQEAGPRACN